MASSIGSAKKSARSLQKYQLARFVSSILAGAFVFTISLLVTLWGQDIREALAFGYLIQILGYTLLNQIRHEFALIRLLQPSMISLLYIGLNCAIGAWAFNSGNVVNMLGASSYSSWRNIEQMYILISICLFVLYLLSLRNLRMPASDLKIEFSGKRDPMLVSLAIMFLFSALAVSTTLSIGLLAQVKTIISAGLIYTLYRYDIKHKHILAFLVVVILASVSSHSKREAIFAVPAIFFIILAYSPSSKADFKKVLLVTFGLLLTLILVIAMSIVRGYGGYDPSSLFDAIAYIPEYIQTPNSLGWLMNNFELSYIFLHLHNCISVSILSNAELAYGETYIRVLVIGPIGDLVGYKPESIIAQYTGDIFPGFRAVGGSFGVTSIGEAVWNFGWFGPVALALVYGALDGLYVMLIKMVRSHGAWTSIFALNALQFTMYYTRGSGLDLLIIYLIISAIGCLIFTAFLSLFRPSLLGRAIPQGRSQPNLETSI